MNREEVLKLSRLARIDISDSEAESLSKEFDAILGYVGEVKAAASKARDIKADPVLKNIFREDSNPHESGIYTEKILNEAPSRSGDYIKVKKIIG